MLEVQPWSGLAPSDIHVHHPLEPGLQPSLRRVGFPSQDSACFKLQTGYTEWGEILISMLITLWLLQTPLLHSELISQSVQSETLRLLCQAWGRPVEREAVDLQGDLPVPAG